MNEPSEQTLRARYHAPLLAEEKAIRRADAGEFGWCDDCGEFIGFGRLDLDPVLMRCVSCAGS